MAKPSESMGDQSSTTAPALRRLCTKAHTSRRYRISSFSSYETCWLRVPKRATVRTDVATEELASYCLHALGAARSLPSKAAVRRLVEVTLAGLRPDPGAS